MQNPFEAPARTEPSAQAPGGLPGVGRLYTLAWVDLGWSVVSYGLFSIFPIWDLSGPNLESFFLATTLVWGVLGAAWAWLLYGYAKGRDGTSAHGAAQGAFFSAIAGVVLWGLQEGLTRLGSGFDPGRAFNAAAILLGLGGDLLLVWSLRQSLSSLPSWAVPTYGVLRGVVLFLALPQLVFGPEGYAELFRNSGLHELLRWVRMPLNLAHQGILIFILSLGRQAPFNAGEAHTEGDPGPGAQRDLMIGAAWLIGGLFVTLMSYQLAGESGGGRYLVTTGAIVYGAVRIGRGLLRGGGAGR
ncbi:MAG: hypothetical protein IPG45_02705 [Deltaproteobacteria bacterium]|nr:hypothetical protein [Deltaproteobacteria bacterium]